MSCVLLTCGILLIPTHLGTILSNKSIINTVKNEYILSDSKNFYKFTFSYLYNYLNCTLTESVFQFRSTDNFHEVIYTLKKELNQLKEQRNNKNLWFFFEFNLFDSLIVTIENVEILMRNYGTSFIETFNEFQLSSIDFGYVSKNQMTLCKKPIFDTAITSMTVTSALYVLERVDISDGDFVNEFIDMLHKTIIFFNFVFSLLNEHNVDLLYSNQKEIYLFLKVSEQFHTFLADEDMKIHLYDSILLKNKYGNILTSNLFKLFERIFFIELDESVNYYNYIEVHLIYINTPRGMFYSSEFSREHPFFALTQQWKNDTLQNEGVLMIRIPNQFRVNPRTKHSSYFDSDIIFKSIMHTVHESASSSIKFYPLYSQKSKIKIDKKQSYKDNNISLIVLVDADYDETLLIEFFHNVVFSDAFLYNDEHNKKRFQVVGSSNFVADGSQPNFKGFFSHGLNAYILHKITSFLKPGKKLLHISILAATDNSNIKAREIAERMVNNFSNIFSPVLLYEKDMTEKIGTLESKEKCESCVVGYGGLYVLYLCIFIPIFSTIIICIIISKKIQQLNKDSSDKIRPSSTEMKNLEPSIIPLS